MTTPAVQIAIKRKAFGQTDVLADIAFDVMHGETIALTGPSGIGKTTLLRILCGLDEKYDGKVKRPERIALVFQEPTLLPWRTALQNIVLAANVREADASAMMRRVGLGGKDRFFPRQLSLGQQRRLSLARAFAAKPDLLVMDEPFASLDDERAQEMMKLTRELINESGAATIFVTHSDQEASTLAERILVLSGSPARLEQPQ